MNSPVSPIHNVLDDPIHRDPVSDGAAARFVVASARDADDAALLLEILGLGDAA